MNDDLQTYIEPELEARLVALVLGEASAFEAEELERLMSERVELQACRKRLEEVHGVLVSAHESGDDEEWKLADERRGKIFAKVEEDRLEREKVEKEKKGRRLERMMRRRQLVLACAACVVVGLMVLVVMELGEVKDGRHDLALMTRSSEMSPEEALAALDEEIIAQSDLVQEYRKDLTVQVQQYGIPYFEDGQSNPLGRTEQDMLRNARTRLDDLEVRRDQLEGKIEGMVGEGAPASAKESEVAKLELANRMIGKLRDVVDRKTTDTVDLSLRQSQYNQAKEDYEQSRAMLQEMQIKQQEARAMLQAKVSEKNGRMGIARSEKQLDLYGEEAAFNESEERSESPFLRGAQNGNGSLKTALAELDEAVPAPAELPLTYSAGVNLGYDDHPDPMDEPDLSGEAPSKGKAGQIPRQVKTTTKPVERGANRLGFSMEDEVKLTKEESEALDERVAILGLERKPAAPVRPKARPMATTRPAPAATPEPVPTEEFFAERQDALAAKVVDLPEASGKPSPPELPNRVAGIDLGRGGLGGGGGFPVTPATPNPTKEILEEPQNDPAGNLGDVPVVGKLFEKTEEKRKGGSYGYWADSKNEKADAGRAERLSEVRTKTGSQLKDVVEDYIVSGNEGGLDKMAKGKTSANGSLASSNEANQRGNYFLGGGTVGDGLDRTSVDFINPVDRTEIPGIPPSPAGGVTGIITGGNRSGSASINRDQIDGQLTNLREGGQKKNLSRFLHSAEVNEGIVANGQSAGDLLPDDDDIVWSRTHRAGEVQPSGNPLSEGRGLVEQEKVRRESDAIRSDEIRNEGVQAYAKGDYEKANWKYREALATLPPGTATEDRRQYLNQALQDSSIALTQKYRRSGKYQEARELLDEVEKNDPGNEYAKKGLEYLDDPIRTSGPLTPEHSEQIDKVRRNLYKGEGYYDLGLYDKANEEFKEVLRTDPYNKAARRWMERTAAIKSSYYRAAYDQTRAEMLTEVDKAWELAVPGEVVDGDGRMASSDFLYGADEVEGNELLDEEPAIMSVAGELSIVSKLDQIVIPEVRFKNATVGEALEFVRVQSVELDRTTLDESKRGFNLIVDRTEILDQRLPDLALEKVTVNEVLKRISEATGESLIQEDFAVRFGDEKNSEVFLGSSYSGDSWTTAKLHQIIVPEIDLKNVTVAEAIGFIRNRSKELDVTTAEKTKKGINLGLEGVVDPDAVIGELKLKNVPLKVAIQEIARQAGLKIRVEEQGVVFVSDGKPQEKSNKESFETSTAVKSDSTFSLNVSDVSFKLAKAALANGKRPEVAKVRAEEFVNALDYDDSRPTQAEKVACEFEQGTHPFMSQRNLMRISMSTASLGRNSGTPLRLTLLLDQSGSMERADRVESLKRAFALLAAQLNAKDEVTLIGFARTPRLLAERVKGNEVAKLAEIIANPLTEGGTNLEEALAGGLQLAKQQFVKDAQNRIILLTDGAANLGDARPEVLAAQVEAMREAGISFDACGVGADGLNDEILSSLAKKGDGRYYFLDRPEDADEGFARQIAGALRPAAKNVKVQVLFNPERVSTFKLYGFEKHKLKKEDFRNDSVDAAEMAAEESGVALYHFEPNPEGRGDVGTVAVRFLDTASNEMVERTWVIPYEPEVAFFKDGDPRLRLAGVAGLFAERLKGSPVGERVELKKLRQELQVLKPEFGSQTRFRELQTMLRQAGD